MVALSGCATTSGTNSAVDHEWAWDIFFKDAKEITRCRGVQTLQLVEDARCSGKPVNDYRWPGPYQYPEK